MAIAAPIAGAYTGTFNRSAGGPAALNYTRQGFNLNFTQKGERVEETDLYGLCLIDIVSRGAQLSIDMICKVYSTAVVGALFPWAAATLGSVYSSGAPISQLANTTPDVLVLTAVSGTPAASSPGSLTANVTISPDQNMQIVLNSTLREVPLRFDVLLQDSAGTGSLLTLT